jgi:hypothetical protein
MVMLLTFVVVEAAPYHFRDSFSLPLDLVLEENVSRVVSVIEAHYVQVVGSR